MSEEKKSEEQKEVQILGFLGVGLDNEDGHTRITKDENFTLMGGSEETHEQMQETAIRFGEELKKKGKKLPETSSEEALDMLRKATDH